VSILKSSAEDLTLNADGSGNDIIFQSNGSTVVTVVGEGNVGIGVTPESSSSSYKALRIGESGNISSHTGTAHTLISNNAYIDTSDNYKYTETDQACLYEQDNAGKHYFKTAVSGSADAAITWTTPLTIANTGDITVGTGDIVFTTAGKGICLGVTSNTDANTLDDYEEGTWTPTIEGSTSASGQSYGTQQGKYVKVGSVVHAQCYVTLSAKGTIAGSYLVVKGLPFASSGSPMDVMAATIARPERLLVSSGYTGPYVQLGSGSTQMLFMEHPSSGSAGNHRAMGNGYGDPQGTIESDTSITIGISYYAAT